MKRKTAAIIVVGLIIVFMLAGLIAPLASKQQTGNSAGENIENNIENSTESNAFGGTEASSSEGGGSNSGKAGSSSGNNNGDESEDNNDGNVAEPESHSQNSVEGTPSIPTISFPYDISGTGLVIEQVGAYDGYFIEDGSDAEVSGIAAIVLKNNGSSLEFVGIGISQGTRSLAFTGSLIPAGATVILQEQNRAEYSLDPYYSATATTKITDGFEMSKDLVSVKDNGKNKLVVTNISNNTIPYVKIFFKNYLPDENIFVGGISYSITLENVEPETSTEVTASHYDSKYSVVLEVSTEQ